MGLLKLLAFPVSGPLWVANVVLDQAQQQHFDLNTIRKEMLELEERFSDGQIDRDTFEATEKTLLDRWRAAREYHRSRRS